MSKTGIRILIFAFLFGLNFSSIVTCYAVSGNNECSRIELSDDIHNIIDDLSQIPDEAILDSEVPLQVFDSEPERIQTSNGGETDKHFTSGGNISVRQKLYSRIVCRNAARLRADAASPRFFYVIALRRILC
ncbi:MAG: hypothetical protein J6U13_03495 [Salinivirgaceae bacterium]|nr:hypothetical protein [Salinivirgaceae bacterium]